MIEPREVFQVVVVVLVVSLGVLNIAGLFLEEYLDAFTGLFVMAIVAGMAVTYLVKMINIMWLIFIVFVLTTAAVAVLAFFKGMYKALFTSLGLFFGVLGVFGFFVLLFGIKMAINTKGEAVIYTKPAKPQKPTAQEAVQAKPAPPLEPKKPHVSCDTNVVNKSRAPKTQQERELVEYAVYIIDNVVNYLENKGAEEPSLEEAPKDINEFITRLKTEKGLITREEAKAITNPWNKQVFITDYDGVSAYSCNGDIYLNPKKDNISLSNRDAFNTVLMHMLAHNINFSSKGNQIVEHDMTWWITFVTLINIASGILNIPCQVDCKTCKEHGICTDKLCSSCKVTSSLEPGSENYCMGPYAGNLYTSIET